MDDLAALSEITGPNVLEALSERYQRQQLYTYFGDFLLCINPCFPPREDESQLGQWYRKSKPLEELPPHVLAVAHRVYRMLLNDFTPQVIVLTGRTGSGKTYAARSLVSQLMREARLSPMDGFGPKMVMAQHVLKTLVSGHCPGSPLSTRALIMNTLYCRSDGNIVAGEVCSLCLDKWRLLERPAGCGCFTIFYAMLGGMRDLDRQKYYLADRYRILDRNDGSALFLGREDLAHHVEIFDFFLTAIEQLGIDMQIRTYSGQEVSALFALFAAILHLGNVQVTPHPQTGKPVVANHHELGAAADLLCVRPEQLDQGLLFNSTVVRGEVMMAPCTVDQATWRRDSLLVEIYRRMISVVTGRLNATLAPQPPNVDPGALSPITVVEAPAFEDLQANRLEAFLRNMAAEQVQRYLNEVIFRNDVEACEREKVQAYKIKYADNAELMQFVFKPEGGILTRISMAASDPGSSPESFLSHLDKDKALKKSGYYSRTGKKGGNTFIIQHTVGQVTYDASDFLSRNHGVLPEDLRQLLLRSGNPLVTTLAGVTFQAAGYPPEYIQPESFFATSTLQNDLAYLTNRLESSNLHYIRCLRPNPNLVSPVFDQAEVTSQLKEACVVEMTRQRKFGYSACMTQQDFVRNFRTIAFSTAATVTSLPEACEKILEKAGLSGRGLLVTKNSVFLRYWHINKLHALKAEDTRRIIVAQSAARRFLVRRRIGGRLSSQQQVAAVGQFFENVSGAGAWAFRVVQEQADHDRNRFESQLQDAVSRGHRHPSQRRFSQHSRGRDPYMEDCISDNGFLDENQIFYNLLVEKVLSTQDTLPDSTWAKIIYMERGKQVAKVYVDARSVIVDGSYTIFDGDRFGLGACKNPARDDETAYHRSFIQEGVRLKGDQDGNIWACRLCDYPVTVKGLDKPDVGCLSADVLMCKGQLPFERTIKVFDITEFRSKAALDLQEGRFSRTRLRRSCVIGLSFGRDDIRDLETACWLCIVNLKAVHALDSDEIVREAHLRTTQLMMTSEEESKKRKEEDDAKARATRSRWAKIDQRDHLQMKEEGKRQMRQKLRAQSLNVGEHLGYSWEQTPSSEKTTMGALQQWADTGFSERSYSGVPRVRSWAKVETAIRDQRNRLSSPTDDKDDMDMFGVTPDYD